LLTENVFLEIAVKECVGDVELPGRPPTRGSNREHSSDGRRFYNWSEGLPEINAGALGEPPDHPPCFIALEGAVGAGTAITRCRSCGAAAASSDESLVLRRLVVLAVILLLQQQV